MSTPQAVSLAEEEEQWVGQPQGLDTAIPPRPTHLPGPFRTWSEQQAHVHCTITRSPPLHSEVMQGKSEVPRVSCLRVRITETSVSVLVEAPGDLLKSSCRHEGLL